MHCNGHRFTRVDMYLQHYTRLSKKEKEKSAARRNIIYNYSWNAVNDSIPEKYTQNFMKQVDIIQKKRELLLQYNLMSNYNNISLTKEDINIGFEQIMNFKTQNNIQTTLGQLNDESANVVNTLINKIKEISCPILMTNNQFGNLSNVITLNSRIFQKIVESILQSTNELKEMNSSIISILAKNIVQYIPSTPLYPRSKYVLNDYVVKVSYVPIQTNIIRQLRKILKILIPRIPFYDLGINHIEDHSMVEIQCANVTFYEEIFDWIFEGKEWKVYNSNNVGIKKIETVLNWLKEGNGMGYGQTNFHTTLIEIEIIPVLIVEGNYGQAMQKLKMLRNSLIKDPTQRTILDDNDTITFALKIKNHTAGCLNSPEDGIGSIEDGIGSIIMSLDDTSECCGCKSIKRGRKEQACLDRRYVKRLRDLKEAISKLEMCISDTSDNANDPNSNGITPLSFDELNMKLYKGSNYYPYGFYREQKHWKECMLETIKRIYKQTRGEFTPIVTTTNRIQPHLLRRTTAANGKQMISVILCRNIGSIMETVHPRRIVSIENSNITSIPSITLHGMDINYDGAITPYMQQCYELWNRYTTQAIIGQTCNEIQKQKAEGVIINQKEVAILISSLGINSNFNDIYNIAVSNMGFEKQSHHIPFNTIHGVIIKLILGKSETTTGNTMNSCYLIFNSQKKQIEMINIYGKMLNPKCSIESALKVIMNDNVNDGYVIAAFQSYSDSHEINKRISMDDTEKKQKANASCILLDTHNDIHNPNIKGINQVVPSIKTEHRSEQAEHKQYLSKNWTFVTPSYDNMVRFYQKYDAEIMGGKVVTVSHYTLYELARRKYTSIVQLTAKK